MGIFKCESDFHGAFLQAAADVLYPVRASSPMAAAPASPKPFSILTWEDNILHGLIHYTTLIF